MIFVTLGSQKFQFNRLLQKVDELLESGVITAPVFAQTGASDYQPKHYPYQAFLSRAEFEAAMNRCSVVITHGGTGSILGAVKKGKKVIAVPRLAQYGEHVDDHQLQLLRQFGESNLIYTCYDCEQLGNAVLHLRDMVCRPYQSNNERWLKELDAYISSI